MAFKRPLSVSPIPRNTNETCSPLLPKTCKVCGDGATRNNYGALTCQSCKTFFRRRGYHHELIHPCQYDGQCEVNMLTRKVCAACRFSKCCSVGMSQDLIRKEDLSGKNSSSTKKSKASSNVPSQEIVSVPQLPTLNLLRHDQSLLSSADWTLFSNVVHAFDRFCFIPELNATLENITTPFTSIRFTVLDALKTIGCSYEFLRSFLMATPDFQILTVNEQRSLLDRNVHGSVSLCSNVCFRDTNFFDNAQCCCAYITLCGLEMVQQLQRHTHQLDADSTILKLMLPILVWSSNNFMVDIQRNTSHDVLLHGTFRLLGSQNVYVDLVWKYMLYKYGYDETAIRFSRIITCLLGKMTQAVIAYQDNDVIHGYVEELSTQMKETLSVSQRQPIPLWGKTISSS